MSQLYENLRQLITLIDELRDVGLQNYISLPRIAAIGTQSSGKSSLIESIVGIDFLPRGGGVVTRRPLELRLVHLNTQEYAEDTKWAIFERHGDKKFTDFEKVREEIQRQTDEVAGVNKGIINDPILLTIYATGAPDLTLIDLPGVTRVSLKGSDQVEDIEKLTREMSLHYIQDARTICLAVLPANQDMSVSDALQLARQVDPKGSRTIGVVTKIDIMDQGTDAVKMLRGEDIPLKLGYVGVKMRSQQDITENKPIKQALQEEKAWFENHRLYSKMPPGMVGTTTLISKLSTELFKAIRRFLPQMKKEINEKRRSVQDRLDELGQGVPLDEAERLQVMWSMITDYCEMFKNTMRGKYDRKLQRYIANMGTNDHSMSGGSKVRGIMNDFLVDFVDEGISSDMTDEDIDRAIRMHEGDSLPGFPSPDTFEFLALPHLQKIQIPSVECVHNVASALDVLSQRIAQAVFRRFPKLAEGALEMTQNIIAREKEATRLIVEQQVACHTGYLFTNDISYLTDHGNMESCLTAAGAPPPPKPEAPPEPGQAEKLMGQVRDTSKAAYQNAQSGYNSMMGTKEAQRRQQRYSGPFVTEIRKRLDAYFAITVRNVRDSVPKAIGFYLVRSVQEKLQFELLNTLKQPEKMAELLGEPPHIMEERRVLSKQLEVLQKAYGVLTRDPTLAAIAFEAEEEEEEEQQRKPVQKTAPSAPARAAAGPAVSKMPAATSPATGAGFGAAAGNAAQNAAAAAGAGVQRAAGAATAGAAVVGAAASRAAPGSLFGDTAPPAASKNSGLFDDDGPKKPAAGSAKNPLFG